MTKRKPDAKMGRPPEHVIDYEEVERLGRIGATQAEIASVINIPLSTLEKDPEFRRVHKKGLDHVKMSLRRMQLALAAQGNATMQIWLGKNLLGQSERPLPDEAETGALAAIHKVLEEARRKHDL